MGSSNETLTIVDITCFCGCVYTVEIEKTPWTYGVSTVCPECGAINLAYEIDDFRVEV